MVDVNTVSRFVNEELKNLSVNKRSQVTRLVYEIAKKEQTDFKSILGRAKSNHFAELKKNLVSRRYPNLSKEEQSRLHFTELNINSEYKVNLAEGAQIVPDRFVIEESVIKSPMVRRLREKFSHCSFETVTRYKDAHNQRKFDIKDYNNRTKSVYIVKEEFDFYKRCACSFKSVYCGLHIINLGSGCAYECAYCYLQDYINSPGIVLPANLEDFFEQFETYDKGARYGSGELTDSLIFDHITEYSPQIVEFFSKYPKSSFEFKTKSTNIDNLLKIKPAGNIMVSWSMNPQSITESVEHYTASLDDRIAAAKKCADAGYNIGFHFDPMIYYHDWKEEYKALVDKIYAAVPKTSIQSISLGTLRMTPRLKKIIENRFPETKILNEEFLLGHDGKLRYRDDVRTQMYSNMRNWIKAHDPNRYIYLCMEEKDSCESCSVGPLKKFLPNGENYE